MRLALLLLLATFGVAGAQPALVEVEQGSRVRVSILVPQGADSTGFNSRDQVTGTLLRYDASTMMIEDTPAIPWTAVSRLELSAGRHGNAGRGMIYGALIGLLAGVVTGATIGRDENGGENSDNLESEFSVGFGLAGLLVGGGIGAIVGGASKTDDWQDVMLVNPAHAKP